MKDGKFTADDIYALLKERYGDKWQYSCAAEVGDTTGGARRRLDFVAVDCYPSHAFRIHAFEIKISKSDLRRELEDPTKHNIFFKEVDTYTIVAPDYVLDNEALIPPKWGIFKVCMEDGRAVLKVARKPLALNDDHMSDRKVSRPFFACLCRAINGQSLAKRMLNEERKSMEEEARKKVEWTLANGGRVISGWEYDEFVELKKLRRFLGHYGGCTVYDQKRLARAQHVVNAMDSLESHCARVEGYAREMKKAVKEFAALTVGESLAFAADVSLDILATKQIDAMTLMRDAYAAAGKL